MQEHVHVIGGIRIFQAEFRNRINSATSLCNLTAETLTIAVEDKITLAH